MGGVTVRPSHSGDVTAFLGLFVEFLSGSIYRTTPVDIAYTASQFLRAIREPGALALTAEDAGGNAVGFLVATAGKNMFGVTTATDLFTYALPGSGATPPLLRAYRRWSANATIPGVQTSSGRNYRYERLLEHLGYVPIGVTYAHRDSLPAAEVMFRATDRGEPAGVG